MVLVAVGCTAIAVRRLSDWRSSFPTSELFVFYRPSGIELSRNGVSQYFPDEKTASFCRAIELNDHQAVEWNLSSGIDVNYVGKHGITPLLWALLHRRDDFYTELLRHGANPDHATTDDVTYLSRSIIAGDSFLIAAAKQMQLSAVIDAVPFSQNLNHRDASGSGFLPPYIFHTSFRDEESPSEVLRKDFDQMVKNGLDVNMRHERGSTALHISFKYNTVFAILLLEHGADPMIANDAGMRAIDRFYQTAEYNPTPKSLTTIFKLMQEQGYIDRHLTLIEAIKEQSPTWIPRQDLETIPHLQAT